MHRRNFVRNSLVLGGASFLFRNTALASLWRPYEFTIRMLRGNVGIFTERGGSIGFYLGKEGAVVIDSQFPDTAAHLIEDLKNRHPVPVKFLLNTHHHGDHTGGNIAFKSIVDKVIAHENAIANLKKNAEKNNNLDKQYIPNISWSDEYKLKLDDEKLKGDYYGAAHTNGDAVYHFTQANVMHVGDLMFNKRHPFVDRTAGASMRNWTKVLDKIYRQADKDTIIIFGHSLNPGEETGSREELMKFKTYLEQVLNFAEQEIKKGVSREDFLKNKEIPGNTLWQGQGIERPLGAAYDEVSQGK